MDNEQNSPDYFKYPMVQTYVSLARSYKMKGALVDAFHRYVRALDVCYINNADEFFLIGGEKTLLRVFKESHVAGLRFLFPDRGNKSRSPVFE